MRRGFTTEQEAFDLLDPPELPDPKSQFPDLAVAVERVSRACTNQEALAICGDYDADGMTSSALLLQALTPLGARPTVAIPSRSDDGYGLNPRMVQELHDAGIRVLITVDNGVSARAALELARDLAMHVAATAPAHLSADDVPQERRDSEKELLMAQARDSGKPEEIIEKMVEGRLRKFLGEITLMGQPFVKDPDMTVEKLCKQQNATIIDYARIEVGEGIEKKQEDFAAEVKAQAEKTA